MKYAGKELTTKFRSARDALAYAMDTARGPRCTTMRLDNTPREYRDPEAGSAVRAILRGDLGIEPGSPLWKQVEGVIFYGQPHNDKTRNVERRVRAILGQHGMLDDQPEVETVEVELEDVVFIDIETGAEVQTVREVRE